MPINIPSLITNSGNGQNLYSPYYSSGGSIIPDPLVVGNLTVNNTSLLQGNVYASGSEVLITNLTALNTDTNKLKVHSGNINLLDNNVENDLYALNSNLYFNGNQLVTVGNTGVEKLNGLQGNINLQSANSTIQISEVSGNINLEVAPLDIGVRSLNGLSNIINLKSANATIAITEVSGNINLEVAPIDIGVRSLNGQSNIINLISSDNTITISNVGSNINLQSVAPAVGNTISGSNTFDTADRGNDVGTKSIASITASNGLGGEVDIIANNGFGGINGGKVSIKANGGQSYGEVDIVANAGSFGGLSTGGLVTITANSGLSDTTVTSAIKLSAAGINSYAGAIPSVGSVAGYNFIYGNGGVNICAGLPSIIPNAPLTTYIYGTNGVEIPSSLYSTTIYPYWDGSALTVPNLLIRGRTLPSASVDLQDVNHIFMTGDGIITGVNSINGSAYPPVFGGVSSLNTLNGVLNLTSSGSSVLITPVGQNINLEANVAVKSAVGSAGSIQYSNGSGNFQGNNGLIYNGTSRITNATGLNYIDINEFGNANSIAIQTPNQLNMTGLSLVSLNSGDILRIITSGTLQIGINGSNGTDGQVLTSDGSNTSWENVATVNNGLPYTLSGTTAGAVIVNRGIGAGNALIINTFTIISTITFNLPSIILSNDSIYYDGFILTDFDSNFNSYWGITYTTNTFLTETILLGSITNTANAIDISNTQQIYFPLNLIIPPTHLTGGGTITLRIYCRSTSSNHYLTIAPINTARIGIVKN